MPAPIFRDYVTFSVAPVPLMFGEFTIPDNSLRFRNAPVQFGLADSSAAATIPNFYDILINGNGFTPLQARDYIIANAAGLLTDPMGPNWGKAAFIETTTPILEMPPTLVDPDITPDGGTGAAEWSQVYQLVNGDFAPNGMSNFPFYFMQIVATQTLPNPPDPPVTEYYIANDSPPPDPGTFTWTNYFLSDDPMSLNTGLDFRIDLFINGGTLNSLSFNPPDYYQVTSYDHDQWVIDWANYFYDTNFGPVPGTDAGVFYPTDSPDIYPPEYPQLAVPELSRLPVNQNPIALSNMTLPLNLKREMNNGK